MLIRKRAWFWFTETNCTEKEQVLAPKGDKLANFIIFAIVARQINIFIILTVMVVVMMILLLFYFFKESFYEKVN